MNLFSFVNELVKVGAMDVFSRKEASGDSDVAPDEIEVKPAEASSRVPLTAGIQPTVSSGMLGPIGEAKNPIDEPTLNHGFAAGASR